MVLFGFMIAYMKRFRKINMHFLNAVLIQFFHDQTDAFLCDHFITGNRQAVQVFDEIRQGNRNPQNPVLYSGDRSHRPGAWNPR